MDFRPFRAIEHEINQHGISEKNNYASASKLAAHISAIVADYYEDIARLLYSSIII